MPGTAEAGDLFGAAVTQLGTLVAVGAPKQDVGTARDTGQVHLISWTKRCGAAEVSARLIHQDGTGVPSVNESATPLGRLSRHRPRSRPRPGRSRTGAS